jgi:hypothetical protein
MLVMGITHQEGIIALDIYVPNIGAASNSGRRQHPALDWMVIQTKVIKETS